jgi:hypothetical protein
MAEQRSGRPGAAQNLLGADQRMRLVHQTLGGSPATFTRQQQQQPNGAADAADRPPRPQIVMLAGMKPPPPLENGKKLEQGLVKQSNGIKPNGGIKQTLHHGIAGVMKPPPASSASVKDENVFASYHRKSASAATTPAPVPRPRQSAAATNENMKAGPPWTGGPGPGNGLLLGGRRAAGERGILRQSDYFQDDDDAVDHRREEAAVLEIKQKKI